MGLWACASPPARRGRRRARGLAAAAATGLPTARRGRAAAARGAVAGADAAAGRRRPTRPASSTCAPCGWRSPAARSSSRSASNGRSRSRSSPAPADRTVCVDLVPRGHPRAGRAGVPDRRRRPARALPAPARPGRPEAEVRRRRRRCSTSGRGAKVTFAYADVGLRAERIDWSATSTWKGRAACAHAVPRRRARPRPGRPGGSTASRSTAAPRPARRSASTGRRRDRWSRSRSTTARRSTRPRCWRCSTATASTRRSSRSARRSGALAATSRSVIRAGDVIGDHTWSHPVLDRGQRRRPDRAHPGARSARRPASGPACCGRPYGTAPAGVVAIARSLGLLTIQWDVDPGRLVAARRGRDRPARAERRPPRRDRDHARRRRPARRDGDRPCDDRARR